MIVATTKTSAALADWPEQIGILIAVATGLRACDRRLAVSRGAQAVAAAPPSATRRLTLEKQQLDTAVNNMTQGLLMFDSEQRLVICNKRYIEMYGLAADIVKPGCTFHDVIAHRKATGSFEGDVDHYVALVLRDASR